MKHHQGLTHARDEHGRTYTLRPDGTIILPIGERPPDLTDDQTRQLVHQRLGLPAA